MYFLIFHNSTLFTEFFDINFLEVFKRFLNDFFFNVFNVFTFLILKMVQAALIFNFECLSEPFPIFRSI